jgi:hypothetical protein
MFCRAEEIGQDLTRVALTYSSVPNIQSAVECMARLATSVCHHGDHLLSLAHKCFNAIAVAAAEASRVPNSNQLKVPPSQVNIICDPLLARSPCFNSRRYMIILYDIVLLLFVLIS